MRIKFKEGVPIYDNIGNRLWDRNLIKRWTKEWYPAAIGNWKICHNNKNVQYRIDAETKLINHRNIDIQVWKVRIKQRDAKNHNSGKDS